jgi:hypothetical protein
MAVAISLFVTKGAQKVERRKHGRLRRTEEANRSAIATVENYPIVLCHVPNRVSNVSVETVFPPDLQLIRLRRVLDNIDEQDAA